MRDVGGPAGPRAIGYGEDDLPELVAGALKQQRLRACAPCPVGESDLKAICAPACVTHHALDGERLTYSGRMLTRDRIASING